MWWLSLIMILFLCISPTMSLVAYDCSQTEVGKIYSLMDVVECAEAYPFQIKEEKNVLYHLYQESGFRRAKVRECIVKRATYVFHCGKWSHSSLIKIDAIPRPVDILPENCEAAFQTKQLKIDSTLTLFKF